LNENFNQNPSNLSKKQRKNFLTDYCVNIKTERCKDLIIRDGQVRHKLKKDREILDLPYTLNENGKRVIEKTYQNVELFKERILYSRIFKKI